MNRTLATAAAVTALLLTGCTSAPGSTPPRPAPSTAPTTAAATEHATAACKAWKDVEKNADGYQNDAAKARRFEAAITTFVTEVQATDNDPRYDPLRRATARFGAAMSQQSMPRAKAAVLAINEACSAL